MATPVKSIDQIAASWSAQMQADRTKQNYLAGVQRVTESPTARAATADAMQRYVDGVNLSVSNGKRAASLSAVTLQMWQQQASGVGADRLKSGAVKGSPKYRTALQKWQPVYQQARDLVAGMPKGTREAAKARSNAVIDLMMSAAGK